MALKNKQQNKTKMQGIKITFTEAQVAWLVANFADTKNDELCERLGCGGSTLHRWARKLGLTKSRDYMANCNRASLEACWEHNKIFGNDGKRNLIVHGVKYRFKKGERPIDRLGEEGERRRIETLRKTRNELLRRERLRIKWGLSQLTNIKLVLDSSAGQRQRSVRYSLKRRGYIVSRGAKVIYYDGSTKRSAIVERNAEKKGLTILSIQEQ